MTTLQPSTPVSLSMQQGDKIRLQRIIQQRKRMEYLSSLICEQKNSIAMLKQQNHQLTQSYCDLKLQNQLLQDKLNLSGKYNDDISQILVKQSSLLQSFRQLLLGTNLHISQHERQCLLEQIQNSYENCRRFNLLQSTSMNLSFKYGQKPLYSRPSNTQSLQIARLTEQNQQLNEKYQQLCRNYLQLSKDIKLKELQIVNLTNIENVTKNDKNHSIEGGCGHIRNRKIHNHIKNSENTHEFSYQQSFFKRIIKEKDSEILSLNQQIRQLKIKHQKKDQLIKWHRKNQKQQKKLLHFFKNKFNLQGKQLCRIASHSKEKSKHLLNDSPSKIQGYIGEGFSQNTNKKFPQKSSLKQSPVNVKNQNQSSYLSNLPGEKSSISFKKIEDQKINDQNSPEFKRTLAKNAYDM